jgi:AraC-like DNA-binding protein
MRDGEAQVIGRGRSGAIPHFLVHTHDPGQCTEALSPIAPGSRIEAISRSGFAAQLRAWRFSRTGLLSIKMSEGQARLPSERSYASLTVASSGTCLARGDPQTLAIEGDAAHFLFGDEPTEFRPGSRCHVLGANLDTSLLMAHVGQPAAARRGSDTGSASLLSPSAERNSLRRFFNWIFDELSREDSSLYDPRVSAEVESVLAAMLVEACFANDEVPTRAGDDSLRRAEEFLAASVSKAVSLAEVAAASGVSVRTLTRGFRERHGIGPIRFLHRRRLEAARRDLLASSPGEARVTDVAHRYCFAHTGRFAIAYRRTFGESPSETLRR